MSGIDIVRGYVPGAIGRIAEMHGAYYHREWGFGRFFEAKVATELSEFLLRTGSEGDGLWVAVAGGRVEGSIGIDGRGAPEAGAHLRWFIVGDAVRGRGVGRRLLDAALGFCREQGHRRVHLWTFEGLHAARHLYEQAGFVLLEQRRGAQWGTPVDEQHFELRL